MVYICESGCRQSQRWGSYPFGLTASPVAFWLLLLLLFVWRKIEMVDFEQAREQGKVGDRKGANGSSGRRMGLRPHFRYRTSMIMLDWIYAYRFWLGRGTGWPLVEFSHFNCRAIAFDHQTKSNSHKGYNSLCSLSMNNKIHFENRGIILHQIEFFFLGNQIKISHKRIFIL